jgi:NAD(P)H dehydrogenase (quinone)
MDTPRWWNRVVYRNAVETSMKTAILAYCGVKTVGITRFSPVRFSEAELRGRWVTEAAKLSRRDAAASITRTRGAVAA